MCQLLAGTRISKFNPQYDSFVKFDINILWGINQQGPDSIYKVSCPDGHYSNGARVNSSDSVEVSWIFNPHTVSFIPN
jgi:hypothetical protein